MPRTTNDVFRVEKNAQTNKPIWLYRISVDGIEANDLFYAEYDQNVSYFKDVSTAQVYTKCPITHDRVTSNTGGNVDSLSISVGNVDRTISAFIEANDGFRSRKVTIRKVFANQLADASAYAQDIFYVDTVTVSEAQATFTLSTNLDILNVLLPGRRYTRNRCHWTYKGTGCWISDGAGGWNAPTGFTTTEGVPLWGATPKYASATSVLDPSANLDLVVLRIQPKDVFGLVQTTDHFLTIDIYADPVANLQAGSYIFLSSDGTETNGWKLTDLTGLGIADAAWTTLNLATDTFAVVGAPSGVPAINYVKVFGNASGAMTQFGVRSLYIRMDTSNYFPDGADSCEKTLGECTRHNGVARYGAFPTIPWSPIFRA